jgi:hypothetical protein
MTTEIRIKANEAKRLKNDTAFEQFVQEVRDEQHRLFADSEVSDVDTRENAHSILRALNQIEFILNAALAAEVILDRKERK